MSTAGPAPALRAALLFAVDPAGLGGVVLRCGSGPARERWLAALQALLPPPALLRRVPLHAAAERLHGGLDLAATLAAGRPLRQRGLLAEAAGGVLVLAMAERLTAATAAAVAQAMERGPGFGVVALDEGRDDDERPPAGLRERLAFEVDDPALPAVLPRVDDIAAARRRLAGVELPAAVVESLAACTLALGVDSARALLQACRAACASAAWQGRAAATAADAAVAAALVLAPRATRAPPPPSDDGGADAQAAGAPARAAADEPARRDGDDPSRARGDDPPLAAAERSSPAAADGPPAAEGTHAPDGADGAPGTAGGSDRDAPAAKAAPRRDGAVDDLVLQAALAALPRGLLALLATAPAAGRTGARAGRVGAQQAGRQRGRPQGTRRDDGRGAARLNLVETLRAAAPWQAVRRREQPDAPAGIRVRREDFRAWRLRQRSETTTVFVVDASGSAALHRLAEAKGAVELLLADCYVRRDSVAVIAFRGAGAEVLLPPTRSLVRAKRGLAGLPGGGGTPLAAGIAAATTMADAVRRRGAAPVLVLLTDGRANVARDGQPGRAQATADALAAGRQWRLQGTPALLIDTSPQPQAPARALAQAMGARYLPLPHAGAAALSQAVRAASS